MRSEASKLLCNKCSGKRGRDSIVERACCEAEGDHPRYEDRPFGRRGSVDWYHHFVMVKPSGRQISNKLYPYTISLRLSIPIG